MCTNLSLLHAAGRVTDGGDGGDGGRQRALRPLPGPGCSGSLLCRGRMTGTFTEPGRGGPVPRSRDPGRPRKSTDACPSPCLPRTASPSGRTVHSLVGWMWPIPSPGYSVVWEADLPGWLPRATLPSACIDGESQQQMGGKGVRSVITWLSFSLS